MQKTEIAKTSKYLVTKKVQLLVDNLKLYHVKSRQIPFINILDVTLLQYIAFLTCSANSANNNTLRATNKIIYKNNTY